MADINSLGNLNRNGIKPLKYKAKTANDPTGQTESKQSFSVEALKNGGNINLGSTLYQEASGQNSPADKQPVNISQLRQKVRKAGQPNSRQARNAQLTEEEKIARLGKIRQSAIEYEAVFVDHLVKQMRQSPLTKTPGGEVMTGIAEQPFRDFLSQAGGLGLADGIVDQIAHQEGLEQTLHNNPGIMGPNWRPSISPNVMKGKAGQLKTPIENQRVEANSQKEASPPEGPNEAEESPNTTEGGGRVGLLSSEEIAWLYQEAAEVWA